MRGAVVSEIAGQGCAEFSRERWEGATVADGVVVRDFLGGWGIGAGRGC